MRSFALKARDADRKAASAADAALRLAWEDVARNWRLLARQLRATEDAEGGFSSSS